MVRRVWAAGIFIILFAAVGLAANVDGRWEGKVSGPNGDLTLTFNFKAEGSKLTGSVETPNGENPITDGKVDGDKISFKTHFQDNTIDHEGTVSEDTIQLKVHGPWGDSEMTLKRASDKNK
jgi:hypothetical protein